MDQIITFDKTYSERLKEFTENIGNRSILAVSEVKQEWSFYLELVLDPNAWQAIWKIPRVKCEKYKIVYPTIVLVYVKMVDFGELTANVHILAVQDDISVPATASANLTDLWPTQKQDSTIVLNIETTANALDMYRFFYSHLWMPYDIEDDDDCDWIQKHLEPRLRLHYDLKTMPAVLSEKFSNMLIDARRIYTQLETLQTQVADNEFIDAENGGVISEGMQSIIELRIKAAVLQNEVELIEKPIVRAYHIMKDYKGEDMTQTPTQYWLVFQPGNVKDYLKYLTQVEADYPQVENFKIATSLQNALDEAYPNDLIVLSPGKHQISSLRTVAKGTGTIAGFRDNKNATIIEGTNQDVLIHCAAQNFTFKNLTINVGSIQVGVLVRAGVLNLQNCNITGRGQSTTQQGILVLTGAELNLVQCKITGFYTGIFLSSDSTMSMKNSRATNLGTALRCVESNTLDVKDTEFSNCKNQAIFMETEAEGSQVGDVSIFDSYENIRIESCTFYNNEIGNAVTRAVSPVCPVTDLFSDPKFNCMISNEQADNEKAKNEKMDY